MSILLEYRQWRNPGKSAMWRGIRTLFLCVAYGAVGTVLVKSLYTGYLLIAAGEPRVPPVEFLLEKVQVVEYLVYGAVGGAALGLLLGLIQFAHWARWRARTKTAPEHDGADPDAIIRADNERRAEEYMAGRTS